MFRRTLGETVEIETVIAAGLWNCFVDPGQFENVLLNLAINARDAMKGEGKLTIEAGNSALDDTYIEANPDAIAGQYVMIAVTDTGSGIDPEHLERVFEPFFTTKAPGEGTGLGLSMVFGFVKQSGGHIKLYSEPGEGTTVRIYLPRSREAEDAKDWEESSFSGPVDEEVVLVVEDDPDVRSTTVDLLSSLGYMVIEAANADDARQIIEKGTRIDLLFTDVVMPGKLKSQELARWAKEKVPELAVLFTSGYTQNAIVHAGRLDEGIELLSKPYNSDQLSKKIQKVLQSAHDYKGYGERGAHTTASARGGSLNGSDLKLRILIVEDEPLIRMSLVETMEDLGHECLEVGSIGEARRIIASDRIDVMISDLGLSDGSATDFIRELADTSPELRIVVITGAALPQSLADLRSEARIEALTKPFTEAAIRSALGAV